MTGENNPDTEGTPEFEGVPDSATCANCTYSEALPVGPELKRQRICRRFPPAVVVVPVVQNGNTVGFNLSASPVPVDEKTWCYEWDERDGPEVEPTGLLIQGN